MQMVDHRFGEFVLTRKKPPVQKKSQQKSKKR